MTIEECEKRNQAVLESAKQWAKGEEELEQLDFFIICEKLHIPKPRAIYYCAKSKNPNEASTATQNKRVLKELYSFFEELKTILTILCP